MLQDYLQLSISTIEVGSHQLIIIQQWSDNREAAISTQKNQNLISNWFIKPKDLDFNQKISSTIYFFHYFIRIDSLYLQFEKLS